MKPSIKPSIKPSNEAIQMKSSITWRMKPSIKPSMKQATKPSLNEDKTINKDIKPLNEAVYGNHPSDQNEAIHQTFK
jgi:hypothetical protein